MADADGKASGAGAEGEPQAMTESSAQVHGWQCFMNLMSVAAQRRCQKKSIGGTRPGEGYCRPPPGWHWVHAGSIRYESDRFWPPTHVGGTARFSSGDAFVALR